MKNKKLSCNTANETAHQIEHTHFNTLNPQRNRLLNHLQQKNHISTDEARTVLDIMHPAARIKELRAIGYLIICQRAPIINTRGIRHNMGVYTYIGKNEEIKHV